MDPIARVSILIAFLGLLCLIVGYTNRDRDHGPYLIWGGVMLMLAVIVHHILRSLQ